MNARILIGDARIRLGELADKSVQTCVTSPPYFGLRDYGHGDQMGLESTPDEYVKGIVDLFREVWRVLADDGTLWLNLGDSYASMTKGSGGKGKSTLGRQSDAARLRSQERQSSAVRSMECGVPDKNLLGIPWRVAFALQADGWYLRQDIIWAKPNPMPESVRDRCTKSHEYLFLLSKNPRYYCDMEAIAELAATGWNGSEFDTGPTGLRNKRDVWTIPTKPFKGAHFAVMPEALVEPCVLAGSRDGDLVLDPFAGTGTVGVVSLRHQRNFVGCELNPEYAEMARARIANDAPLMNHVEVSL